MFRIIIGTESRIGSHWEPVGVSLTAAGRTDLSYFLSKIQVFFVINYIAILFICLSGPLGCFLPVVGQCVRVVFVFRSVLPHYTLLPSASNLRNRTGEEEIHQSQRWLVGLYTRKWV